MVVCGQLSAHTIFRSGPALQWLSLDARPPYRPVHHELINRHAETNDPGKSCLRDKA